MPNLDELKKLAKNLANNHDVLEDGKLSKSYFPNIEEDNQLLIKNYKTIYEQVKAKERVVPAAEWLLDNFYMIEEQIKELQHGIAKGFKDLPMLKSDSFKGLPRVYAIAEELISYTNADLSEEIITSFLREYQSITPLKCAELWVFPFMLKIALIKRVNRIAMRIVDSQKQKLEARKWADRFISCLEESTNSLHNAITEHDRNIKLLTSSYAEGLFQHFKDYGSEAASLIAWLEGRLALQGTNVEQIVQAEQQQQLSYQVSIGNAITSLRFLSGIKWEDVFEELSLVEQILREDPEGSYTKMEFASRDYYRHQVEILAKEAKTSEIFVAHKAVECAKEGLENSDPRYSHIGYYLIGAGREQLEERLGIKKRGLKKLGRNIKKNISAFYLASIAFVTFSILAFILYYVYQWSDAKWSGIFMLALVAVTALIPASNLALGLINWLVSQICRPCYLPKLELKDGIPEKYRTMVVIPTLLSSEKRVEELIEQMEVFYLANQEKNLHFALVGDFKDSKRRKEADDENIVQTAIKAIQELNERYGRERKDIFFFFHRHRQWNASQSSWMGWERKRGALVEFNRLLRGDKNTSFSIQVGELDILDKIKYVITLDADTQLPRDAAKRLIGTMAHPLNRPILNEAKTKVIDGYGLLQPRIGISVDSASRSYFSLTFSGQTGVDPYTTAVSDVYQDLFCEGIFTGKGIYDVDIFNQVLGNAIPENTVLSHDLLEGSYVRAGLVTDIELIDGYPSNYMSYSMRLHRWVRGDWQLIPWLFSHVKNAQGDWVENPLDKIAKWKIIDNMRRSLLHPTLFLLLLFGLSIFPGSSLFWIGFVLLVLAFPLITDLAGMALARWRNKSKNQRLSDLLFEIRTFMSQIGLTFVFLAHQAYMMTDAVIRTIARVFYTRRNMLEWVTAADAERRFKGSLADFWRKMWPAMAISIAFFAWISVFNGDIWLALLISIIWLISPWIAYKSSKAQQKKVPDLTPEQIYKLRLIGRKTWKYFDDFITAENNWLPPDNFQVDPPVGVAHRTSPTNIGIGLVSILGARDMGYIGTIETIDRLEKIFHTLDKLEKWEGHFYNWYDTRTLKPLKPKYVSSVDSGNLACYLVLLKQGIKELVERPLVGRELVLGLQDTIRLTKADSKGDEPAILNMLLSSENITLTEWRMALNSIDPMGGEVDKQILSFKRDLDELVPWVDLILDPPKAISLENDAFRETAEKYSQLLGKLNSSVTLKGIMNNYEEILDSLSEVMSSLRRAGQKQSVIREVQNWLRQLELSLGKAYVSIKKFYQRCSKLADRIENMVQEMDFKALYDENMELFSIGYDVESGELSKSYYDLLASEARQTSFIAIAKGDVPQKHWFKLGRPLTLIGDLRGLLSWSGTMFEYLMPLLIMRSYNNTLLDETYHTVVEAQKQYGEQRRVPWGVSESAFYAFDLHLNYQYKAFGVPQMGLKRGLVNDIVITPYASVMALMVDPVAAMENIERLLSEGMDGEYGLYEAIDYTPERLPHKKKSMVVKNFMAHHQGMSFLAINNYLNNNIMQRRFHAIPMVKATELLLQERIPKREIYIKDYIDEDIADVGSEQLKYQELRARRRFNTGRTVIPQTHLLSNGNYTTVLTNSGAGYSQYQGMAINRWRSDATRDNWGIFFFIHNLNSNEYWSATEQPCGVEAEKYEVVFEPEKAIYTRKDGNIETKMEVVVSPEHNVEIRRITLTNNSEYGRVLEVTSYFEPIITGQQDDMAHPAFSNLFVQTEYVSEHNTLLATRRLRSKNQRKIWLAHSLVLEGEAIGSIQYETSRQKFIGRGRDLECPRALDPEQPLSNTVGSVLDPIMSLRQRIGIGPGQSATISFIIAAADSRESAIALAREYQSPSVVSRAFELAWTHSQVEMRYLNISDRDVNLYQAMASNILFLSPMRRLQQEAIIKNTKGKSGLWAFGISGDLPIVVVEINKVEQLQIVRQMLAAHEYWRLKGLFVDLVIINRYGNSYEQPVEDRVRELITVSHARDLENKPGGVFLISSSLMSEEEENLFKAVARLYISPDKGSIESQIKLSEANQQLPPPLKVNPYPHQEDPDDNFDEEEDEELLYFNGLGGFAKDGSEYVIRLAPGLYTPMPWSNIIANDDFGFIVTESGGGYTWYKNSRQNKLTPWSNDPVRDTPGEIVYIRDEDKGNYWTITPLPIRKDGLYKVRHGQGYSVFQHSSNMLQQSQTMFVSLHDPVKFYVIKLKNKDKASRRLSVTLYVEWVLGVSRMETDLFIVTEKDEQTGALLARNPYNEEFGQYLAFISVNEPNATMTGDRAEFIGRNRSLRNPNALEREGLSGSTGAGYDPCGALQVVIELKPGEEREIVFTMGQGEDIEKVRHLIQKYHDIDEVHRELQKVKDYWKAKLGVIQVSTPDMSMNILLNSWLIYQTLSSRLKGRTGFYQAGGAFGFRDQLQDVMALAYSSPERMKQQILINSEHQFTEGDVQHWWHPPRHGIRTRITDDLLFLPYVTADYIRITGDWSILDEETHYLKDEPLRDEEEDRYNIPGLSEYKDSIYNHCIRAIEKSLNFGRHGLPLIGTGDWNDGMNSIGDEGKGESVWLGWFLYTVLDSFIPICKARNDNERAARYAQIAKELKDAIEENGWDGGWYRRAYFDDGTPLGSEQNDECRIDSISQSWAVISGAGKDSRIKIAMRALETHLVDREAGLIRLLYPPFNKSALEPGYIKGYVPGVRENGGQYTHAATWAIMAFAKLGEGDKAWELYHMINPINHTRTNIEINRYMVEPYVMAADVYAAEPHVGRGGWTWYTGSAAWMYRVGVEHILGFKLRGDVLYIDPCIPKDWKEFTINYRYKDTLYRIDIVNPDRVNKGIKAVIQDGEEVPDKKIFLVNDGKEHQVRIVMGRIN